mgnify:CR=1 FL=1
MKTFWSFWLWIFFMIHSVTPSQHHNTTACANVFASAARQTHVRNFKHVRTSGLHEIASVGQSLLRNDGPKQNRWEWYFTATSQHHIITAWANVIASEAQQSPVGTLNMLVPPSYRRLLQSAKTSFAMTVLNKVAQKLVQNEKGVKNENYTN